VTPVDVFASLDASDVLLRVGANVQLLKKLGWARESAGTVYLWRDGASRQTRPPLVLRLVVVDADKHPVYLVTSVLSPRLSFAKLPLAFRRTMRDYLHPTERGSRLCERLRRALIDRYVRKNKASRNYPRKKQENPPALPNCSRRLDTRLAAQRKLTTCSDNG